MTHLRRRFVFAIPLILSAALIACSGGGNTGNARSSAERDDDIALGDPSAPIVMVEYASLTCPHCAAFHEEVFPALKARYIDTGKVRFIFRQFPTPPAPYAVGGEAVARCAGPDKYFDLLDVLYEKQSYWVTSNNARQALMEIAATAGINQAQFDACVSDESNIKRIQEVVQVAQDEFGINSTPSFVINGKLRPQLRDIESFAEILDPILGIKYEPAPEVGGGEDEAETGEH